MFLVWSPHGHPRDLARTSDQFLEPRSIYNSMSMGIRILGADMFGPVRHPLSKRFRVWLGITVAVSSVTLIGGSTFAASVTAQSSLRCGSDHLSVVWRGTTGGLAGTFGDLFWVRNDGDSACVISGFPSVAVYFKDRELPIKTEDLLGHNGNDQMGVTPGRRVPSIRLSSGGVASFWVFGNDVTSKCINGDALSVSLRSLNGFATIPVPRGFQYWIYCGGRLEVNPLVPGASGSYPPRSLRSVIR